MADGYDTMLNPPVEKLVDKTGSKFTLVQLSAKRSREITDYFGELGAGIGVSIPPQVTSKASKALTMAFEEIAAGKIHAVATDPDAEAAAAADAAEMFGQTP